MLNLVVAAGSYIFPGVRTIKLIKSGINVTNSTNPLIVGKNITLVVIDCCAPPPLKLVAHCVAGASLIASSIIAPNPLTMGAAVHAVTEIFEIC